VLGLAGAWLASILGKRQPGGRYTYGLRRSSILAALGNAIVLLVVTGGIAWEGIRRLMDPEPAGGFTIMVVAAAGILVNGVTAFCSCLAGKMISTSRARSCTLRRTPSSLLAW
jgi:cobalt-zinc-cadmium efflux system protein